MLTRQDSFFPDNSRGIRTDGRGRRTESSERRPYFRRSSIEKPPLRELAAAPEELPLGHLRAPGLCAVGLEAGTAPASGLLVTGRAKALCASVNGPGRVAAAAAAAKGAELR